MVLANLEFLYFYMNFRTNVLISEKNKASWVLVGITFNLKITLESIAILTVKSLLIHKHGISFHLFRTFNISFYMFYSFQNTSFVLLSLFLNTLLFFKAILNRIL